MPLKNLLPGSSPEEIVKGFVENFLRRLKRRIILSVIMIVATIVFFATAIAGTQLFGQDQGFKIGAAAGFVLAGLTMFGLNKLIS